jgi:ubiquinone/menaquinone biosynthesis C-methylase UbiE
MPMIFKRTDKEVRWATEVIDLSWAYRAGRLVQVAHGAGIFERLAAGRATAAAIARDRRLSAPMVARLLPALAAMGLVRRAGGEAWQLTPKAAATLVSSAPCYQGSTLAHSANVWSFWNNLESAVRGRRGAWRYVEGEGGSPIRSHRDFILAMHDMAMAGRAAWLAERVNVKGRRKLMDVGGGPGSYAMALCERNPGLRATVFDLPKTVKIAREVIARLGMSGRVTTVAGDWNKDDFGRGNDVVLLSNIMHGANDKAEMKLAKARKSLVPGGLLIVQDFLMNAGKTGPPIPALFNVMVGAFSLPEMTRRIAAAGFKKLRARPMPANVGTTVITAEKSD